jgi:hypothetical protein
VLNEFQDEKNAIEEYKKEIKKLREELTFKEKEKEKELLQQIIKTNESLTFELEDYKGKYMVERERNELMRSEMENIKYSLVNIQNNKQLTSSQYSGNNNPYNQSQNNSNFISLKENFFPSSLNNNNQPFNYPSKNNFTENLISSINDDRFANFTEVNNVSQTAELQNNPNNLKRNNNSSEYLNINSNIAGLSSNKTLSPPSIIQNNNGNTIMPAEESFLEAVVNKINKNFLLEGSKKLLWQEESQRVNSEYK